MDGRHWLDDGRCEDARHSIDGVVVDVAGTHGQVHDFAGTHEDAFQGRLVPGPFDAFDGLDDKRGCDLIDLSAAKWSDDVALHPSLFVLIRDDPPALEVLPQCPRVAQDVASRRFLAELLALAPSDLPGLQQRDFWPMAERNVCDTAAGADAENPRLGARRLNLNGQTVAIRDGISFFTRL